MEGGSWVERGDVVERDIGPGFSGIEIEGLVEGLGGFWHEGFDEDGDDAEGVGGAGEDLASGVGVGFDEFEGSGGGDEAVCGIEDFEPDSLEREVVLEGGDERFDFGLEFGEVDFSAPCGSRVIFEVCAFEAAVEVFDAHGDGAGVEVSEVIGEVGVVEVCESFERELAIAAELALAHKIISKCFG